MTVQPSQIRLEEREQTSIISISGELDYLSLTELTQMLQTVGKSERVVISLEQTTYLDSIVLHSIVEAAGRLRQNRRVMILIEPRDATLKRLLDITGVSLRIKSVKDVAAAIAFFTEQKTSSWDGIDRRNG